MIDKNVFAGHIACVMSALWARVKPEVLHLTSAIIGAAFDSKLDYHSVHKRGFEGTCTQGYVEMPVLGTQLYWRRVAPAVHLNPGVCSFAIS